MSTYFFLIKLNEKVQIASDNKNTEPSYLHVTRIDIGSVYFENN